MSQAPINLNRARKARLRAAAEARAQENRVAFGRTKAEKLASLKEAEAAARRLEAHRRDDPAPPNEDGT